MTTDTNVLRTPYAVARRNWIEKLVEIGLLQASRRRDANAVERALNALRQRSREFLET